ncbi:hypothetical protein C1646_730034 [Rhizophagus diaphanus]|nr:hypothetical protein C1646_730034 [Rhizophagus diaphanus] [Rhizophagus sp. MUCL 43196]
MAYTLPPTPISPITERGLSQHDAIIRRYNIFRKDFYKLPKKFINEFKKTLCIFGGPDSSSKLAQIFNNVNWGTKYYNESEMISVVINLDDIDMEKNPLDRKRKYAINSQKKSRYKRGEVVIEWKPRLEKNARGNKCEGGFLHVHFWITKKRII